jgi:hypothetical protein
VTLETGASDLKAVETLRVARERILAELRKVIVGQDAVIEQLLTALFANGHVLLVGVPGWPRRCSSRASPGCWISSSTASSSPPT